MKQRIYPMGERGARREILDFATRVNHPTLSIEFVNLSAAVPRKAPVSRIRGDSAEPP
jgi:hypothetical protein